MHSHIARFAAVLLLFSVAGCASVQSLQAPDVQLTRVELLNSSPGSLEQRFGIGLRLINPNNRSLAVDGLDFELELNGRRLARGVTNEAFELPRLGEADTTVIVTTSVLDVLRQALGISSRADEEIEYRLRGRVHLGSGFVRSVPFDHRGKLTP